MDVKFLPSNVNYYVNISKKMAGTRSSVIESVKEFVKLGELKETNRFDLQKNVDNVNKFMETNYTAVKFQIHEELDRVFVEVVDQKTKEVVREIPSREFLDMISSMLDHVGLFVDRRV